MPTQILRVLDLLEMDSVKNTLGLKCVAGKKGLDRIIETESINRPGLALGGYFTSFAYQRVQVFGKGEANFLNDIKYGDEHDKIKNIFAFEIPCFIFSNNNIPPEFFINLANEKNIPVLVSEKSTDCLVSRLFQILSEFFAKKTRYHGTLIEILGIGLLIKGESGIGKSEIALALIERGHRLIADDTIDLKNIQGLIIGEGTSVIGHHMEIHGLGIIDVKSLFGVGAVRDRKQVQLVIELEYHDPKKEYDRLGLEEKYVDLLDVKIPYLSIPVLPGRNISIIIETAAMNQRLKMMGINSAKEFNNNLIKHLETEEIKNTYIKI
jgi:HPr kinase/phosphorylase